MQFDSLHKLDGQAFTEKDKEGVNFESKVLSIGMIMDCSKDQRKGFETQVEVDEDLDDDDLSPKQQKDQCWETQIELLNLAH